MIEVWQKRYSDHIIRNQTDFEHHWNYIEYNALKEYGYNVIKPCGAFYLFVKALEADANAFCEKAKEFELLLVQQQNLPL